MNSRLRLRAYASVLWGAALIATQGVCLAGSPQKGSCQKGDCHSVPGPSVFERICEHYSPPILPVLQSQAVRSVPATVQPMQMQLQVQAMEQERARAQDEGGSTEQFRGEPDQKGELPRQKGNVATEPARYMSAGAERYDGDERIARLEQQMSLLLLKLDRLVEQQEHHGRPQLLLSDD